MNLSDVKLVDSEFAFVCTEWVHSCKLFCTLYVPCLIYSQLNAVLYSVPCLINRQLYAILYSVPCLVAASYKLYVLCTLPCLLTALCTFCVLYSLHYATVRCM